MKNLNFVLAACFTLVAACTESSATIGGNDSRSRDGGASLDAGKTGGGAGGGTGGGTGAAPDAGRAMDICGNGLDDNNDGFIDEGCTCTPAATQPCWSGDTSKRHVGACKDGIQTCTGGGELVGWGACGSQQSPTAEVPGNCIDEDCDGVAPGCPAGCGSGLGEICNNGIDDNCDGKVDCADQTCLSNAPCVACPNSAPEVAERCFDGIDNDCNGKVDCSESTCAGEGMCATCTPAAMSELDCTNHVDDDCDGKIDCADPDCRFPGLCGCTNSESCHNGIDDDCDGATDCADVDCEICKPGAVRWCDEPNFCRFGNQTCQGDGTWGRCHEVKPPDQCKRGGIFGNIFGSDYDQACCVKAGLCCQNYSSGGGSIGVCGDSVSCKP